VPNEKIVHTDRFDSGLVGEMKVWASPNFSDNPVRCSGLRIAAQTLLG
jgi:hypothetical protein